MTTLIKDLIPAKEAARILGIQPDTLNVWRATKRYNIPYVKVGSRVFYRQEDLLAFIRENMVGAAK